MNRISKFVKFFFYSKFIFGYPPAKKVLIYDNQSYEILKRFFKSSEIHVFDTRHFNSSHYFKEKIYLRLIFDLLLDFKISKKNYIKNYLSKVRPKLVITIMDNYPAFYALKQYYPKAKFIAIQNSHRSALPADIFYNLKILQKDKNLFCDYILVFNAVLGKLYTSFCSAKFIVAGSIRSNFKKINHKKKLYDLLYISCFRDRKEDKRVHETENKTWKEYYSKEEKLIKNLYIFAKKKKLTLSILGSKGEENEKKYFDNLLEYQEYKFIPKTLNRDSYKIVDQSKIIINTDSTLGYEAASRGGKVMFFSVRGLKKPYNSKNFGWPLKKKLRGKFWSNDISLKEINRLYNFLKKDNVKHLEYIKKEIKKLLLFDYQNSRLKNLLKKILNFQTKVL